jgi:hypothetical protein
LEVSLVTVAVNEAVPPAGTLGEPAVTATEMAGGGPTTEAGPLQATIIAVRTVEQFCVFLGMRDKTRAQIMTMLRRSPRQKTNRPGLE